MCSIDGVKTTAVSVRCNEGYVPPIIVYHDSLDSTTFATIFENLKKQIPTLTTLVMDCAKSQMKGARLNGLIIILCSFHMIKTGFLVRGRPRGRAPEGAGKTPNIFCFSGYFCKIFWAPRGRALGVGALLTGNPR